MIKAWAQLAGDTKGFELVLMGKGTDEYERYLYNLVTELQIKNISFLGMVTGKEKYKAAMDLLVEQLKRQPRTLEGGFWHKLIYQHQMWLDGLYMASPFLARYGAEFNRPDLIDEAVKQFTLCHKHTYSPETGLYHHAWDEANPNVGNPQDGTSPNFWGRSIAGGSWHGRCTGLYSRQPPRTCLAYQLDSRFGRKLPNYQRDGLWYQVIDQPERESNFPEASVTTQCMYAYAKAVNKGYIDARYRTIAEKAFNGLKKTLLRENPDGTLTLTRCCQVGGLGGTPYRDGSFEYYISEKMRDNDAKATGPFIMGCLQLGK